MFIYTDIKKSGKKLQHVFFTLLFAVFMLAYHMWLGMKYCLEGF